MLADGHVRTRCGRARSTPPSAAVVARKREAADGVRRVLAEVGHSPQNRLPCPGDAERRLLMGRFCKNLSRTDVKFAVSAK